MRNDECRIRLVTPSGGEQVFQKEEGHWVQISTRGIKRRCTAEQVLSHLLPALYFGRVTSKVVRVRGKQKRSLSNPTKIAGSDPADPAVHPCRVRPALAHAERLDLLSYGGGREA